MREILFRGKRADNNEWSIGHNILLATTDKGTKRTFICPKGEYVDDVQTKANRLILVLPQVEVIPETVGQYTGLTDKNGNKIFEGDIGRYKQTDGAKINGNPMICIGKVVYNEKTASFAVDSKDEIGAKNYDYFPIKDFEIIGNIHDNPELLKGGE